jgi:hypothetical protein
MGWWMPGWMIERTAIVRLGAEAARHPELILGLGKHSSSLEEAEIKVRLWRGRRGLLRTLLTPVICLMDERLHGGCVLDFLVQILAREPKAIVAHRHAPPDIS